MAAGPHRRLRIGAVREPLQRRVGVGARRAVPVDEAGRVPLRRDPQRAGRSRGRQDSPRAGELRTQFHHVIDIVPTILDVAGIAQPDVVNGVEQKPIEGVSMRYSFDDAAAAEHRARRSTSRSSATGRCTTTAGSRRCFHGRVPWIRSAALPFGDGAETLGALPRQRRLQPGDRCQRASSPTSSASSRSSSIGRPAATTCTRSATRRCCERFRTTGPASSRARRTSCSTARTCACPSWRRVNVKNTSFDLSRASSASPDRRRPRA